MYSYKTDKLRSIANTTVLSLKQHQKLKIMFILLWNSLDNAVRSSNSLYSFKRKLKLQLHKQYNAKFLPSLYSLIPSSNASVYHCWLRLGLSALNYHRFTYNFIEDKSCPRCNYLCEDIKHYLFQCPAYAAPRAVLMGSLSTRLPLNVITSEHTLENYLIYGSSERDHSFNLSIFSYLFTYLDVTGRFEK